MSFLKQEPSIMVNVKLTDTGRRLLSLGQLTYSYAVLSDREIDYDIDRTGTYSIELNRVMSPKDDNPSIPSLNFDGTQAYSLNSNLFGGVFISTAQCPSAGFYSATTDTGYTLNVEGYDPDSQYVLQEDEVSAADLDGTNVVGLTSSYYPVDGNLALFVFNNPSSGGQPLSASSPFVSLWYRITGDSSSITTDRDLPNFSTAASSEATKVYHFPWNGISNYYGSGSSVDVQLWNMNIVRNGSEIGTPLGASGYTEYGSKEYNGQKHRFNLDKDHRQIGFIHYTNEFTGNTYSEQLAPGSTKLDIYHIMWHRHDATPGEGETMGHRFVDEGSDIHFDDVANTSYTILSDGVEDGFPVGRVYQKLKLIVITDPELLNAMTYKSNRNWTMPPLKLSSRSTPASGSSLIASSGCLRSDKTYYVTYFAGLNELSWDPTIAYGYQPFLHCGYIQRITGYTDSDGNSGYLSAKFPPRSLPYMRSEGGMAAFYGTGWMCNYMSLLIKEVDSDSDPGLDRLSSYGWRIINTGSGSYSGGEDGSQVINPDYAQSYEFIVSQADLDNSSAYTLNSAHTTNIDYSNTGSTTNMNFGNEQFFFGNITTTSKRTKYKTAFSLQMQQDEFNSSNNPTFSSSLDTRTYLTEVGILDDQNRLVAVGKFTQPVAKDDEQFLILQLEMDF